ncbi:PAS domain-containing protein, partial [Pyxidicoccus sp. 3LFB2]
MTAAPAKPEASYSAFDAMPVGVCVIRDLCFIYLNDILVDFLGRPREALLGQPFVSTLEEGSAAELAGRHARRMRGEPVPTTYEATVRTPLGDRRTEMTVIPNGQDWVVMVRDATSRSLRRGVLQRLAELGAGLPSLRTEGEVLRRVFSGLEEVGLAFAWLSPEGAGVRLGQTFVPPDMVPPEARGLSGRWVRDVVGQWSPMLKRAWREGGAYSAELPQEASSFLDGALADEVRAGLQRAGQPHVIAVRIDVEGQPRAMLAMATEWLREEELPSARLFGA